MPRKIFLLIAPLILMITLLAACAGGGGAAAPTEMAQPVQPTDTAVPATATPQPTVTATPEPTLTPTVTLTPTPTEMSAVAEEQPVFPTPIQEYLDTLGDYSLSTENGVSTVKITTGTGEQLPVLQLNAESDTWESLYTGMDGLFNPETLVYDLETAFDRYSIGVDVEGEGLYRKFRLNDTEYQRMLETVMKNWTDEVKGKIKSQSSINFFASKTSGPTEFLVGGKEVTIEPKGEDSIVMLGGARIRGTDAYVVFYGVKFQDALKNEFYHVVPSVVDDIGFNFAGYTQPTRDVLTRIANRTCNDEKYISLRFSGPGNRNDNFAGTYDWQRWLQTSAAFARGYNDDLEKLL